MQNDKKRFVNNINFRYLELLFTKLLLKTITETKISNRLLSSKQIQLKYE